MKLSFICFLGVQAGLIPSGHFYELRCHHFLPLFILVMLRPALSPWPKMIGSPLIGKFPMHLLFLPGPIRLVEKAICVLGLLEIVVHLGG